MTAGSWSGEVEAMSGQANLSYKRQVVPRGGARPIGVMEFLVHAGSSAIAGRCSSRTTDWSSSMSSTGGPAGTSAMHFHNGRSIAGFIADGMKGARRGRLRAVALSPCTRRWGLLCTGSALFSQAALPPGARWRASP